MSENHADPKSTVNDSPVTQAATATGQTIATHSSKRQPALSPTRANDFRKCPLSFRFKYVDGITEPPSLVQERGTLVHSVLEHLFDSPANERTLETAYELVTPRWQKQKESKPEIESMFAETGDESAFLVEIGNYLQNYFRLEFPSRLEPFAREQFIEALTKTGIRLRGIADRIDRAPTGALRVIDYKTSKTPRPQYADNYVFQMKFYALMLLLRDGQIPARLQLLFLKDHGTLHLDPTPEDIDAFAERLESEWCAIEDAATQNRFPTRTGPLCAWCSYQNICPAMGGTAPAVNEEGLVNLLKIRQSPCS